MASITIRNIPTDLLEKLRLRAKKERRSINNEIIKILEDANIDQETGSLTEFLSASKFDNDYIKNVEEAFGKRTYGREFDL